jgi:hypothetical protein
MLIDKSARVGGLQPLLAVRQTVARMRPGHSMRGGLKSWPVRVGLAIAFGLMSTSVAFGVTNRMLDSGERALVGRLHPSSLEHITQSQLNALSNVRLNGQASQRFLEAFELGDGAFDHDFNAAEGGGANVGNGQRFTRVPRADLDGAGQWARHTPQRATGPNASACTACHLVPGDGAGPIAGNAVRDPTRSGSPTKFIERNAPHLFGGAGIQLLAEEMTADLFDDRQTAQDEACRNGTGDDNLDSKGVSFGVIRFTRTGTNPCRVTPDFSGVRGVDNDLIIRPFQWKGNELTQRAFVRGAMHNELGVQGVEMAGANVDGDGDGVVNELTVGDITALAVYMAAQPRPTTLLELNSLSLLETPLSSGQISQINRGSQLFDQLSCNVCHVRSLELDERIFSEPSQRSTHRDATFPTGQVPSSLGVTPTNAVIFDITRDLVDNRVVIPNTGGDLLGSFRRAGFDGARVDLFSDLKRHNMGNDLAEQIDEAGSGASTFLTETLWGVGTTAPYLHDGRATTLTEAILYHTGGAETINGLPQPSTSRQRFLNLSTADQQALLAFLNNLVLFLPEEG